jgi:beta-lactam-binding protein with PASTA domain
MLNRYTHHGENISVPDLRGKKFSTLDSILKEHNFHFKVVDSLYDGDKQAGTVLDQDPSPRSKVKENRTIYLTINATQPPDVKMPDLVDVSFRQAEAILQSFGLITGEIVYKADLAKNAVLEQRYKDRVIKPGTMIPKGSAIDLVLGDGLGESEISIPDLTGMTRNEAMNALVRASLSLGIVHYDSGNTEDARVYKQHPSPEDGEIFKAGTNVDIYLE